MLPSGHAQQGRRIDVGQLLSLAGEELEADDYAAVRRIWAAAEGGV